MESLSAIRLRELLSYDQATGFFTRRIAVGYRGCHRVGEQVGQTRRDGYVRIGVEGRDYAAHRLAWLYITGAWPRYGVDHINGNPGDNRMANLRDVPQAINLQNQRAAHRNNASSRYLGVSFDKRCNKWKACISLDGKQRQIGRFATEMEASRAYLAEKARIHQVGVTWHA